MNTVNRRAFLKTTGIGAAGAAGMALVGCGGGSSSDNSLAGLATPTPSGAASATVDPFAGVKKGGTFHNTVTGDAPTIDPLGNVSFLTKIPTSYVYSRLFMYKTGPGIKTYSLQPTGDLVEKYETSPDGLTWTMHLRAGVKFQNLPPVNGRALTTDDVKFSWGRVTDPKYTNGAPLNATVDKVAFPDPSTIVFTLKAPAAAFLDMLTDPSNLMVMPTEADGKFNPSTTMIGSGPWINTSYTPSVGWKYARNPNWWMTGFPVMDAVELAIIPDYPTRLSNLYGGGTDSDGVNVPDAIDIKKSGRKLNVYGNPGINNSILYFDGNDPTEPWAKDDRVRQAVSMSLDRDALYDLAYSVKDLAAAGLTQPVNWNNFIPSTLSPWWLDPKSKDQGDTGQFFKYDPANAKKLLAAAGYPDGFSTTYQYTPVYGPTWTSSAEANIAYLNAIGIKTTTDVQDYASKYTTHTFLGDFKGMAFGPESTFSDPGYYPNRMFTDNAINHGRVKDASLTNLAKQQAQELDPQKRKDLLWEIQRQNDQHMYYVPSMVGAGVGWAAYQTWMHNVEVFNYQSYASGTETIPFFWTDKG